MVSFDGKTSKIPFTFGQLYGIRSFSVDRNRDLCGPVYTDFKYGPGEVEAKCYGWLGKHPIASKDCTCGFYAYYTRYRQSHASVDTVTGIIGAYGKVSYSNYGFRAAKCRVVAAVNPYLTEPQDPKKQRKIEQRAQRMEFWRRQVFARTLVYWIGLALNILAADTIPGWGGWPFVTTFGVLTAAFFVVSVYFLLRPPSQAPDGVKLVNAFLGHAPEDGRGEKNWVSTEISRSTFESLMRRYPETKWFPDVPSMLKEFPLTQYNDLPTDSRWR